jgi:hypothetical protein
MQLPAKLKTQPKWYSLLTLAAIQMLIGADAFAQNLDEGKSAARLFADSCVTCHRSARGLAKGRYRVTLFMFLREHYVSNSSTALELASYLASVDGSQSGKSRTAKTNSSAAVSSKPNSSIRPPKPVPQP